MNEPLTRYVAVGVTITGGIIGWAMALENRVQSMQTTMIERAPIIEALSRDVENIRKVCGDPSPKPETRVFLEGLRAEFDRLEDRTERIEDRLNNFHNYLMSLPVRPIPYRQDRRGGIDTPLFGVN